MPDGRYRSWEKARQGSPRRVPARNEVRQKTPTFSLVFVWSTLGSGTARPDRSAKPLCVMGDRNPSEQNLVV